MHEKASRVVIKREGQDINLDIAPMHGDSIEEDLRLRDFTINAMAVPLDEMARYFEDVGGSGAGGGRPQGSPLQIAGIIDPLGGLRDIEARRLRAVDEGVFRYDPLRMLRAVRFMMSYRLTLDERTRGLIVRDAGLLSTVAGERVHEELYALLEPEGATARLRLLDELGLFTTLFPEFLAARGMRQPAPHYLDVFEHSLETVGALERLAHLLEETQPIASPTLSEHASPNPRRRRFIGRTADLSAHPPDVDNVASRQQDAINRVPTKVSGLLHEIRNILLEAEQQGVFSFVALTAARMKLAALLHDVGKPLTYSVDEVGAIHFYHHPQSGVPLAQQIAQRLKLSTRDSRLAQQVVAHHMRPGQLAQLEEVTPRAIRRYFVDLGPTGIYVALISLADHMATFGPQPLTEAWERHLALVRLLLTRYVRERESILPPRLVSPDELMRRLSLKAGPILGQLLDEIAEAQAEGTVHSKEEAFWLVEERLRALKDEG